MSTHSTATEVRHITVQIDRPALEVYEFAGAPEHLPEWAAGLASGELRRGDDGVFHVISPMGEIEVEFVPRNDYGVLDHIVTMPDGTAVHNPMRVIPDGTAACEVDFLARRRADMDDAAWDDDLRAIRADLDRLRELMVQS